MSFSANGRTRCDDIIHNAALKLPRVREATSVTCLPMFWYHDFGIADFPEHLLCREKNHRTLLQFW